MNITPAIIKSYPMRTRRFSYFAPAAIDLLGGRHRQLLCLNLNLVRL